MRSRKVRANILLPPAFSVNRVEHFRRALTMQIISAYKMMRFAVSDSKNHWRMTILDDLDLVANSDIGSNQPEISTASPKEAAAMGRFHPLRLQRSQSC